MENREWMGQQSRGWQMEHEGCPGILHRVERGDTLYLLGKKYQVSVEAIMYANPFADIYNLQIGDELCIPRLKREEGQQMPEERTGMRSGAQMPEERTEMENGQQMPGERAGMGNGQQMPGERTENGMPREMPVSGQPM